ncbi:carbonic anhydrase 2-like [Phymastichus coffea]|uniref:carbonic anhydrase 2-like n=1 Tax=Phymastichus coffea TaxID=108790 RepID=UPI00273C1880|nr:carbonic anhydrase 2-like [Phymastichus coffea]
MRDILLIVLIMWNMAGFSETLKFDYTQSGQQSWYNDFPECSGQWQSPIVIAASRSVALPLPALEMIGYHDFLPLPLVLTNNGYTVTMNFKRDDLRKRTPYIFGALLDENQDYELENFHFHWGLRNSRGSEHVLHGTRHPMEMHLIHRNMKYANLNTALQHKDGLVVLGVFFNLQEEDNDLLKPLISHLPEIQFANSETKLNTSIILASFLPQHLNTYYTYRGSLTTPPCNEVVTWIVFASAVPISFKQMSKFRLLSNGKGILADNYRLLQDVHNRKVYVRRTYSFGANRNEINDLDISTLKWYYE